MGEGYGVLFAFTVAADSFRLTCFFCSYCSHPPAGYHPSTGDGDDLASAGVDVSVARWCQVQTWHHLATGAPASAEEERPASAEEERPASAEEERRLPGRIRRSVAAIAAVAVVAVAAAIQDYRVLFGHARATARQAGPPDIPDRRQDARLPPATAGGVHDPAGQNPAIVVVSFLVRDGSRLARPLVCHPALRPRRGHALSAPVPQLGVL